MKWVDGTHAFLTALILALLLASAPASARPGGGQSYGGSSSSHSSGGSSSHSSGGGSYSSSGGSYGGSSNSGNDTMGPGMTLLVLALVIGWIVLTQVMKTDTSSRSSSWTAGTPGISLGVTRVGPAVPLRGQLEKLRDRDPDFSVILFEDFLYSLFALAHDRRGAGKIGELAPYLAPAVRARFATGPGLLEVKAVIVGAMEYVSVTMPERDAPRVRVVVEFQANYTEVVQGPSGAPASQAFWATERWTLVRPEGAKSRPPERVRTFGCPSCGAPLEGLAGNVCARCGQPVDTGEFDWVVSNVVPIARERRGPQLTGTTEETGTNLPTRIAPGLDAALAGLQTKDPEFRAEALRTRVRLIFDELQVGWTKRDWKRIRPFVTDHQFQTMLFWIVAYQRAHLQNVTADASIGDLRLVRVTSDRWYDAVTLRLSASSLDYTVSEEGKVVGGSRTAPRRYTEYWTLIRGSGVRGAARAERKCPSCGAALQVTMAGACEFCDSKVVAGEFDWVLSRIEQDEAYSG